MKPGVNCGLEGVLGLVLRFCVLTRNVWNIWNIEKNNKENQQIQVLAGGELFQIKRNTLEQTGTNLFRHVPGMFHFENPTGTRCTPSALRASSIYAKTVFRNVPVPPEHFQSAVSPVLRGFQQTTFGNVPNVPDVPGVYAGDPIRQRHGAPLGCRPWPS